MNFDQMCEDIRAKMSMYFNDESRDIVLGLQKNNYEMIKRGLFSICERYTQMKNQLAPLSAENERLRSEVEWLREKGRQLEAELEQTREKLRQAETNKKSPAEREDLSNAALFHVYQKTGSFRKTGKLFNCNGKTVKARLMKAGYIKK